MVSMAQRKKTARMFVRSIRIVHALFFTASRSIVAGSSAASCVQALFQLISSEQSGNGLC